MPIIDFHGKKAIQNYEPPNHILEEISELGFQSTVEGNSRDNILIEGDNLLALKSLLPEYEGKIKCIYIDPPYNTNNKDWVYCDNIEITSKNDPAWKQVEMFLKDGNEIDYNDSSRHSKWLCMMYPRLKLLYRLLKEDGVIFVSIDDNEVHHLRMIMDEIFGEGNIEEMIWNKEFEGKSGTLKQTLRFRNSHEYILVGYKNKNITTFNKVKEPLESENNRLDTANLAVNKGKEKIDHLNNFDIVSPSGIVWNKHWKFNQSVVEKYLKENLIYWGKDGKSQPRLIIPKDERRVVYSTSIINKGSTTNGRKELEDVLSEGLFDYPKSLKLINHILQMGTSQNDIILDSFAGSGTTSHAVLNFNHEDGGNRKFITVQLPEVIKEDKPAYQAGYRYVHEITKARIEKVAGGYTNSKSEKVEGLGGGFKYYRIGTPLFTKKGGDIVSTVTWEQLAPYIYFTEFKAPLVDKAKIIKPKVGFKDNTELYLLYKEPNTNTLTEDLIIELNKQSKNKKVIYADKLELGLDADFLRDSGVIFKQIPYDILSI